MYEMPLPFVFGGWESICCIKVLGVSAGSLQGEAPALGLGPTNYDDKYIAIKPMVLNSRSMQDLQERNIFKSLQLTYKNPISCGK